MEQLESDSAWVPETSIPNVQDLNPKQAISVLRKWGFAGDIQVKENSNCTSGNGSGKIYRQEPSAGSRPVSLSEVVIFSGCFRVSFSLSPGGRIDAISEVFEQTVDPLVFNLKAYDSLDFTVVPQPGFSVEQIAVNDKRLAPMVNQKYRLSELKSNKIVKVVFSKDPEPTPSPPAVTSYTITASVLVGDCSISPSGTVLVNEGEDQGFSIVANSGVVALLEVDGIPETCAQLGCSYTFSNVTADHTLNVLCN